MTDLNQLNCSLDLYRSAMKDSDLCLSLNDHRLSVVWSDKLKRRMNWIMAISFPAIFLATPLSVFGLTQYNHVLFILSCIVAGLGITSLYIVYLVKVGIQDTTLDFGRQCLQRGRLCWPFSRLKRIVVRRNLHCERYRRGTAELIPDERLAGISVNLHISALRGVTFGVFTSTDVAFQFATELANLLDLNKVEIDKPYHQDEFL